VFDQRIWAPGIFVDDIAQNGETLAILFRAQRDVILVPLYSAASTTSTPIEAFAGSENRGHGFRRFITSASSDSRTLYIRKKRCQDHSIQRSVKIKHWPHETPSYFRDFLP
jgi:hypothetical protein